MRIGFLGNANNYPFMLARAIKRLGHEVTFVVDSEARLNRPEGRYHEVPLPYPPWIVDCSPLKPWNYPPIPGRAGEAIRLLRDCDALVLNEFGPSLWQSVRKPALMLLTGTDLEVLADPQYADFVAPDSIGDMGLLRRMFSWRKVRSARKLRNHFLRLIEAQRSAIRNAVAVAYFPAGMLPNADRLLQEVGVEADRRVFFLQADIERYQYAPYPVNRTLRLFNVARITWRKPREHFVCELDYKGTDILIRGLGMFVRQSGTAIDIRLVRKGADVEAARGLAQDEGIEHCVTWLDELDQGLLHDEYTNADIVTEHFGKGSIGMGALDAMATGRPVIANASPEIFRAAVGETPPVCHATTPEQVCDQLLRLAADRGLRADIGRQSRAYAEKYFTPERAARIVLERLQNAV